MDELVVYKGLAKYTGNFTVPTLERTLGGSGYCLVLFGLYFYAKGTDAFTVEVIDTGTYGLRYTQDTNSLVINLGGATVTASMVHAILTGNYVAFTRVIDNSIRWTVSSPRTSGLSTALSYRPPFGNQNSYIANTHAQLEEKGFAIHTGDFTIQARIKIARKYRMADGATEPRYAIVGQYEDYLWAGDVDAAPGSWWALEFVNDTFTFKIWDGVAQEYKCNIYAAAPVTWSGAWSDYNDKDNLDDFFTHVAVCRLGNEVKLFVNGVNGAIKNG